MNILAIESSCDETCAAIVRDGRQVLSDVVFSQIDIHRLYGGVVPEIASRSHTEHIVTVMDEALRQAGLTKGDIDAVAVANGAGLVGALLVGVSAAKAFAYSMGVPLIAVSHIRAHVAANYITYPELTPPFVCLVVSGGHTMLIEQSDYINSRVLMETADDAAGEAFDKCARVLGLGYPGGVAIDSRSGFGKPDIEFFKHASIIRGGSFSYSGLKTAVINYLNSAKQRGEDVNIDDVCASFTRHAIEPLVHFGVMSARAVGKLAVAGGVSANSYLRRRLMIECEKAGISLYLPKLRYCTDNAAMVGSLAYFYHQAGEGIADLTLNAEPNKL